MNNPLPRTDSLLSRLLSKQTNAQKVAEIQTEGVLNAATEKKVNQLVTRILDDGAKQELEHDSVSESQAQIDRYESETEGSARYRPASAANESDSASSGPFVLPSVDDSGLFNPNITLDESQVEAVRSLANHQYGALIGAAGTGKTTVQKYLLKHLIYDLGLPVVKLNGNQGLNIAMVAFTGMAVHVMKTNLPAWMHVCCKTIHSLLEFEPEETINERTGAKVRRFEPQRHSLNKLDHDIIVIDEASMVGLDLWMQLLAALKPGTRIYMTGDLNQLPPIIGQPIFAYALSSPTWHVSELTHVHRQKEPGANRITEVAHEVLNGKSQLTFDVLKGNPDWRVIYQELEPHPEKAAKQVINILNQLRQRRIDPDDETSPFYYDPHKDRVMTAGNGYDENSTGAAVQQAPLNERLSYLIEPPSDLNPRIIIDAGLNHNKRFSVNNRVMATKNESPSTKDRVTNGLAGNIVAIERNSGYTGNPFRFGDEREVAEYVKAQVLAAIGQESSGPKTLQGLADFGLESEDSDFSDVQPDSDEKGEDDSGFASHSVTVQFDNGARRTYKTMAGVGSIQLAYCSTVAKCQGSQFDTAIIICHHAEKNQLSREWLYTAITRGVKRVIILGTDYGLRYAISRQKIKGKTLAEKIQRYQDLLKGEAKTSYGGKMRINIPLTIEDFSSHKVTFEMVGNPMESVDDN